RVLLAYESAEREQDGAEQKALLTFVVVGGGPTGVELAGALAEISRQTGARVLAAFPESLSGRAQAALERRGVEVRTRATVTRVTADAVWLGGEQIRARTVLWAAGVAAAPLARTLGVELDRSGCVSLEPDLSLPGHPEVFVIGDMSLCPDEKGVPLPGLAPVAIQQGRHAVDNVLRRLRGRPTRPFRYRDRGTMATIGRAKAVAVVGGVKLSGPAGVARVALRAHHVPDRLSQPVPRTVRVGMGLCHLAARRAADHRPVARPQSESTQERDQIGLLLRREDEAEALLVEPHGVQQCSGRPIVEERGATGETAQNRSLDLADVIELAVYQGLAEVRRGLAIVRPLPAHRDLR